MIRRCSVILTSGLHVGEQCRITPANFKTALGTPACALHRHIEAPPKPQPTNPEPSKARKQEPRCGLCRRPGHPTAECPLKRETLGKVCPVCAGLSWRVPGLRCVCGRRRGSEQHLHAVDFAGTRSSPTFPEGPPRLSRNDAVQVGQRMDQVVERVRRAAHTGEVIPLISNVVNPFFKDELGNRYGSFVVVARCPNTASQARWVLRCEKCQAELRVNGASLRAGKRLGRSVNCVQCAARTRKAAT